MSNGTSNQFTQMFTGDNNAAGIHNEYSAIASGNVTNTVDQLHTAQTQLKAQQDALQQQQSQATSEANAASSAKNQASQLAASDSSALDGVNANIKNLVAQQQAAAAAAAAQAAQAKVVAAQQAQASAQASQSSSNSGGGGVSVNLSPPPPTSSGAAGAVQAAQGERGVPYQWGGTTPAGFDCSGLTMWAYEQVGISLPHYSGAQYDDTTHIPLGDIAPGDLLFYGPGGSDHVAMYIGGGMMVEAPYTGATVTDNPIRTGDGFVGVGRVA
jgi:cell wall-associated NlpC family hydrolase